MKRGSPLKRTALARGTKRLRRSTPLRQKGRKAKRDERELRETKKILLARSAGYCEARFSENCSKIGTQQHHRRRRSQGGTNDPDNLVWTCKACHDQIHALPLSSAHVGLLIRAGQP